MQTKRDLNSTAILCIESNEICDGEIRTFLTNISNPKICFKYYLEFWLKGIKSLRKKKNGISPVGCNWGNIRNNIMRVLVAVYLVLLVEVSEFRNQELHSLFVCHLLVHLTKTKKKKCINRIWIISLNILKSSNDFPKNIQKAQMVLENQWLNVLFL